MTKHRQCFASWMQRQQPDALGLDPEIVGWLCLVMASPEMKGVTSLEDLNKALKLRRTKLRFPTALAWNRAWLSAKTMWMEWKQGAS
jgi:hypothetical protein